MKRLQRAAILLELTDQLKQNGSWCGETHLQKATYFLQELLRVPVGMEFILYKYGPYSFDLTENLTSMRADELLDLKVKGVGYGPSFETTDVSREFRERFPVTLGKYADRIKFIAEKLGGKGVKDLEQLATALFVSTEASQLSVQGRAKRLHQLKPHVSIEDAAKAVEDFDELVVEAAELSSTGE